MFIASAKNRFRAPLGVQCRQQHSAPKGALLVWFVLL
jgi:hypothetical protein